MSNDFENRINELYNRSLNRSIFTFSDFLSPSKRAEAENAAGKSNVSKYSDAENAVGKSNVSKYADAGNSVGKSDVSFFGGCEFSERVIARFGSVEELGYDEPYPIKLLKISVTSGKFSVAISHRDVLGAVLNLGIDRDKIGDIFVGKNEAYLFAIDTIADLIVDELTSVSKNPVKVTFTDKVPDDFRPTVEKIRVSVASNRADAVISRIYNMSREESCDLFKNAAVSINGKPFEKGVKPLKTGDAVAVRGYGKFVFCGECGTSKKGKLYVEVKKYV